METNLKDFAKSAKDLSKNPLGIIALFIVLIYGFGCLVVVFGGEKLQVIIYHPLTWFLAIFPFIVLFVFAYLVAKHHKKLYGPGDYDDSEQFLNTFDSIQIPKSILNNDTSIATTDSSDAKGIVTKDLLSKLEDRYAKVKGLGFCIIHQSEMLRKRTYPKSGRYRVRVWIENFMTPDKISEIKQVSYRVWDDFNEKVFSTSSKDNNFDLWLSIYGEFPVSALIELKNGDNIIIERYIDLQSRPSD